MRNYREEAEVASVIALKEVHELFHSTGEGHTVEMCELALATLKQFERQFRLLGIVREVVSVASCDSHTFGNRYLSDYLWSIQFAARKCKEIDTVTCDGDLLEAISDGSPGQCSLWNQDGRSMCEVISILSRRFYDLVDSLSFGTVPESILSHLESSQVGEDLPVMSFAIRRDDQLLLPSGAEMPPDLIRRFAEGSYRTFGETCPSFWGKHSKISVIPCPDPSPGMWPAPKVIVDEDDLVTAAQLMKFAGGQTPEPFRDRVREGVLPPYRIPGKGPRPAKWSYRELMNPKPPFKSLAHEWPEYAWPDKPSMLAKRARP